MRHFEEHILELYALSSDKVSGQREAIETHLAECHGCRALVEQMTASYRDVEERFKKLSERTDSSTLALTRSRTRPARVYTSSAPPAPAYRPVTRGQQVAYFVRRHPVMVGGGSFVGLAALALFGNLLFKTPSVTDRNPAHIRYNIGLNDVEILNKRDQMLWKLPSRDLRTIEAHEDQTGTHLARVADIDGDGVNEVLTTLWTPGDGLRNEPPLRVYNEKGDMQFAVRFEEQIKYLNRNYPNTWGAEGVVVGEIGTSGQKQIISGWGCVRSPYVITRLDSKGHVIGEYWHFGVFGGLALVDVDGDGKKELILTGQNDALDSTSGEFPAIVVLNPEKIVGASKSAGTPGFDLPLSDAELYYIRLPASSLSRAMKKHESVKRLIETDKVMSFWVTNNENDKPDYSVLEYIFSRDLKIQQVKSTDATDALFKRLVDEGRLHGNRGAKYLEDLKSGVRYWDGKEWRKEAVRIRHEKQLSIVNGQ